MRFPVIIELRRSVRFALVNISFHSLAIFSAFTAPTPGLMRSLLVLLVFCSGWKSFGRPPIAGLKILGGDRLGGVSRDKTDVSLRVCQQTTVVCRYAVLLRVWLEGESKVTSLILFSDQMPKEQFRQLRLWLRSQSPVDLTNEAGGSVS